MSSETELLILCSRVEPRPEQQSELEKILDGSLDWEKVLKKAQEESVSLLVYQNLKPHAGKVPDDILKRLKQIYIRNSGRNLYLLNCLKPVLKSVDQSGIKAAVIKGARLAKTIYKDIGLRFFIDVDLLVFPSHRGRMIEVLKKLGFVQMGSKHMHHELSEREKMYWTYRPVYQRGRLDLELHYNFPGLHMPFSMSKDLWRHVQRIDLEGAPAQILSPEYELCLLCLHSQQHSYSRLDWFTDIAEMSAFRGLDWNKVLYICRKEGIEAPVSYGLRLVNEFWPGTVSEDTIRRFSVSPLERLLLEFFWPKDSVRAREQKLMFPMHAPTFFSVLSHKKPLPFMKAVYQFFFPPRSWVSFYYGISPGSYKMAVHYLWRFWRPVYLVMRRLIGK